MADSLTGLYTIGCKIIDGIQTSVKVSLGTIQTAYENMLTEISNARAATKAANTAASNANTAKLNAEAATSKANTATANAITATGNANTATGKANTAADLANKAAANANTAHDGLEKIKEDTEIATKNANDAANWRMRKLLTPTRRVTSPRHRVTARKSWPTTRGRLAITATGGNGIWMGTGMSIRASSLREASCTRPSRSTPPT